MSDIAAIVPGAGASRRMGRPKLLLPWGSGSVIEATCRALVEGGCSRVVVVTRPDDAALRREIEGLGRRGAPIERAVNPDAHRGMLSSILAAIEFLGGADRLASTGTSLAITPGDHPVLTSATVRGLVEALARKGGIVVPRHAGRRGHPLLVHSRHVPRIPSLDPARGLRQILEELAEAVTELEVEDPGVTADLDTPDDYERLRRQDP